MARNGTPDADDDRLTPRQQRAVILLLRGMSTVAVCQQLKVGRSTLFRWRRSGPFRSALARGQRGTYAVAVARLSALSEDAVDRLGELLRSPDERVALAACTAVLKAQHGQELLDVETGMNDLQRRLDALDHTNPR